MVALVLGTQNQGLAVLWGLYYTNSRKKNWIRSYYADLFRAVLGIFTGNVFSQ